MVEEPPKASPGGTWYNQCRKELCHCKEPQPLYKKDYDPNLLPETILSNCKNIKGTYYEMDIKQSIKAAKSDLLAIETEGAIDYSDVCEVFKKRFGKPLAPN